MPDIVHSQAADFPYHMTTTAFELPGYRIVASLGVVRTVLTTIVRPATPAKA